jgi:hypothetical protein
MTMCRAATALLAAAATSRTLQARATRRARTTPTRSGPCITRQRQVRAIGRAVARRGLPGSHSLVRLRPSVCMSFAFWLPGLGDEPIGHGLRARYLSGQAFGSTARDQRLPAGKGLIVVGWRRGVWLRIRDSRGLALQRSGPGESACDVGQGVGHDGLHDEGPHA